MAMTPVHAEIVSVDDADDVLAVTSFLEVLDPVAAARLAFYDGDAVASADAMWTTLAPSQQSAGSANGADRTDSSSSESGKSAGSHKRECSAVGGVHKPRGKVRKSTYVVRKEKRSELLVEIAALEMRLKALNKRAGLTEDSVEDTALANAQLRESLHHQQLSLATAQSVVSGLLNREHANPLGTPIHLGTDWPERRRTLEALKDEKIRHAYEYLDARARFTDSHRPHTADERFENALGDYCCARYETHQFTGAESVREVFDVLVAYLFNAQDEITQQLGHRTVRNNFDLIEGSIANYHFVTTEHGVPIETHGVLFLDFFDALTPAHSDGPSGPCGILVIENVESDQLYPYVPSERVRKDVTSIKMLTPHYRESADGSSAPELVVTLSQGKFIKLHHGECPTATPEAVEKMRAGITGWGDVMVQTMRESLRRRHR